MSGPSRKRLKTGKRGSTAPCGIGRKHQPKSARLLIMTGRLLRSVKLGKSSCENLTVANSTLARGKATLAKAGKKGKLEEKERRKREKH